MKEEPKKTMEKIEQEFQSELVPMGPEAIAMDVALKKLKEAAATKQVATFKTREDGLLVGSSFEEQYRLAKAYTASGLMPKGLNTPEKVLVALQLCLELKLPPMTSIGKIAVINGTPSLFGDLPLALVMRSGKVASFEEEWFNWLPNNSELCGARCKVSRKDIPGETVRQFTVEDAEKAGLYKNDVWKKYTKRMLQLRARAWALKDTFPDVLSGISIAEWDFNSSPGNQSNDEDPGKNLNEALIQDDNRMAGLEENTILSNAILARRSQGWSIDNYRSYIKAKYNVEKLIQLTKEQAQGVAKVIEAMNFHDAIAAVKGEKLDSVEN